jgi:hypothetical protein
MASQRLVGESGRTYESLPVDGTRGFPQSFPYLLNGRTYHFTFYVNVAAGLLAAPPAELPAMPATEAFLVARVEREVSGGGRELVVARKIVPSVEYEAAEIALLFTDYRVARRNLNGRGEFGSSVTGGIALRWSA